MSMNENFEKRESIRIKDRILLAFSKVSQDEYENRVKHYLDGTEDPWVDTCHPSIQKDIKASLKNLRERDKDLANVLEALDQKLNLVLGLIGTEESFEKGELPQKLYKVDLSAKGIGLSTKKDEIDKGDILKLIIGLLPEHYFFTSFGKVVRKVQLDPKVNFLGIKFIWITEDDQEKLIEHIFARQVVQLRMRRQEKERKKD